MTRLVIAGAKGRMGTALLQRAGQMPNVSVTGQIDAGDDLRQVIDGADVVIDFTFHAATLGFAQICAEKKKALVIGSTGHTDDERKAIVAAVAGMPTVWSANYSTGVNALYWLTQKAAEILGPDFDLEVVEMHHRLKKDAPSGTAKTLAEILARARRQQLADVVRHGREGLTGERTATEIGMHAVRGGDVVGDHTVIFAGMGERLELAHKASSRDTFAAGALRAAVWLHSQKPGLYDMQDVLGLPR
ncbi:MAG TPA: 4-hydroxy-tetrahydrodipicolinate reductase [Verrucomicrobiae bacterium]|jgi:4-hydroxy-tetrahydrodipicolinate reductase|nr:4-hydroxy-tetrahydrodipicolinate reductase [Verrucomicrobiae bacterium]